MDEVAELELPTQENFQYDLRTIFQATVRLVLETVLEEVAREMIGASRWQRLGSRKDVRNGTYLRRLITTMGAIEVTVPRTRENGSPVDVIGRYRRRSAELDAGIVSAYVSGASTRDIGGITEALVGERVSRSTVSRVARSLDEKVRELRNAPIAGPMPYLFLDATFLDARWARTVENVSALVAYGIGLDGKRQLLAVTIGAEESEDSWSELLAQLNERGLSGVRLVVTDAHAGLAKAVRKQIPEAPLQRCTVHLQRNVLTKAPQRLRSRLAKAVMQVFEAPSKADAKKRVDALAAGLGKQVPEAIACLAAGFVRRRPSSTPPSRALAPHPLDERARATPWRDQAAHPRRRRLPGPRERAQARHRRRPPGHRDLERPALSRHGSAGREGGRRRQGCVKRTRSFTARTIHTRFGT